MGKNTIAGGQCNVVCTGRFNSIGGGQCNIISNQNCGNEQNCYNTIAGGCNNHISSSIDGFQYNTIGGGVNNCLKSGQYNTIGGGIGNIISGSNINCYGHTIAGGVLNFICQGRASTIVGGRCNCVCNSFRSTIMGLNNHILNTYNATITGGYGNRITGSSSSTIGGGANQRICNSQDSFIGSGCQNSLSQSYRTFIGGGIGNAICSNSTYAGIASGGNNFVCKAFHSFVGGGNSNWIRPYLCSAGYSAIVGGSQNKIYARCGCHFIGGGRDNRIGNSSSSVIVCNAGIVGGYGNRVCHSYAFVVGCGLTSTTGCTTYMNNATVSCHLQVGGTSTLCTTVGRIDATNDIVAFATSDKRLKCNIKPIENALCKVIGVSGNTFDWKPLSKEEIKTIHGNKGKDVGVIAQEIEKVLPEAVTTRDNGYKAVNYEKIVPLLIEAIRDQQKQIDELKSKL